MEREDRKEARLSQERTTGMKQSSVVDYLNMDIFQYVSSVILLIAAISALLSEFFMSHFKTCFCRIHQHKIVARTTDATFIGVVVLVYTVLSTFYSSLCDLTLY